MLFNADHRRILTAPDINKLTALEYINAIESNDFTLVSTLKDTPRSAVYHIRIEGKDLVYKIPLEKNSRRWIQFLSLFRMGEAFKNIQGMILLAQKGFRTTQPVLACEYRKRGMVADSWLLYEYLPGHSCLELEHTYPRVVQLLSDLHHVNLIHGDPQIRNFILKDGDLYLIDANPKYSSSSFDKAYEFAYLRKSAPGIDRYFGSINRSIWYRLAVKYDLFNQSVSRKKKAIKKLFKSFN